MTAWGRVLVTGASGFAGSHLARALADRGASVRVLVRRPDALLPEDAGRYEVVQGDVRDAAGVRAAVAGCRVVFHLAAAYRDASATARDFWDVNVGGTEHVIAACRASGVERLVHCSTIGVHGSVSRVPSDETAPFNPGDDYQRTKLEGELRVHGAWRTGLAATVVRPAGMYGPGDLRFLKLFRGIQGGYFAILGSGEVWFHPVYIDDLVDGFLLAGARPEALGQAFIIAGDRYLSLNDLARDVAEVLQVPPPRLKLPVWPFFAAGAVCEALCAPFGIRPPIYRRRVDFFTHHRAFSTEKAQRLLGYRAHVPLREGLGRTAAWYRSRGLLRPAASAHGALAPDAIPSSRRQAS